MTTFAAVVRRLVTCRRTRDAMAGRRAWEPELYAHAYVCAQCQARQQQSQAARSRVGVTPFDAPLPGGPSHR